jgi:pyrroline-5-carboxylate reductase
MVNEGMSALCRNRFVSDTEFESVMNCSALWERRSRAGRALHTVIGVSGSSPLIRIFILKL